MRRRTSSRPSSRNATASILVPPRSTPIRTAYNLAVMKQTFIAALCVAAASCAPRASGPTAPDAKTFLDTVSETTLKLGNDASRAGWVQQTYITDDTELLSAQANQAANDAGARFAKE